MISLSPLDARIPEWNMETLKLRLCPFCLTDNNAVLKRPDKLSVAHCSICGCWYTTNIPDKDDILKFYKRYWSNHRPSDLTKRAASQMIKDAERSSKDNIHLNSLIKLHGGIKNKIVLDVGCGLGRFLLEAKALGAYVVGCDLSSEACDYVNKLIGIKIYNSDLHSCLNQIGSVDIVIMSDLIEHLVNPIIEIRAAISILKQNGLLFIYTPNGGEASMDIDTWIKWVGFRVDLEHFQYLSPRTINWISAKFKLNIDRLETSGYPRLEGIERIPRNDNFWISLKKTLKMISYINRLIRIIRIIRNEINSNRMDSRFGSYHLLAILRKI